MKKSDVEQFIRDAEAERDAAIANANATFKSRMEALSWLTKKIDASATSEQVKSATTPRPIVVESFDLLVESAKGEHADGIAATVREFVSRHENFNFNDLFVAVTVEHPKAKREAVTAALKRMVGKGLVKKVSRGTIVNPAKYARVNKAA